MKNNARYDLSDWLIHFFRAVDPCHRDAPPLPEHFSFASVETWDEPFSPFFLMRNAIRQGRIWATWSIRSGRRTIYGPDPAVCFTEMPIAAFVEAGKARTAKGEAMSVYGIVTPKAAMHSVGARPVIYGLSVRATVADTSDGSRQISPDQLPCNEQYRYVSYSPEGPHSIDWTHEREWRWPLREAPQLNDEDLPPDIDDLHGLDIDQVSLRGMGVIVKTEQQAEQMVYDILTKVDRGDIAKDHYAFVLALDAIPASVDLRDRSALSSAIEHSRVDLSSYFTINETEAAKLIDRFSAMVNQIESETPVGENREYGGCWLWLLDNDAELTRALMSSGRVNVTAHGKYAVSLPEIASGRDLREREEMVARLAQALEKTFGVDATYLSVLGKEDPAEVPFYNGDKLDDSRFYNFSNDVDDY